MDWVKLLEVSGEEPADTVAKARAAQILAEMLGIISRQEYYYDGQDQTVDNLPEIALLLSLV